MVVVVFGGLLGCLGCACVCLLFWLPCCPSCLLLSPAGGLFVVFCCCCVVGMLLILSVLFASFTRAANSKTWNHPARAGITTTFRVESFLEGDWAGAVQWWANWHCNLVGFEKIYMFADSKYTVDFVNNLGIDCVEAVPAWEWRKSETEEDLHNFITRQTNNCAQAYQKAAEDGLGWLVHMDVDELFYLDGVESLRRHLKRLSKLKIGSYTYINNEATANKADLTNYFEADVKFKKHPSMFNLTPQELWESPTSVLNQLGFAPPTQGSTKGVKREYFFSYSNGKSIVRVGKLRPGLRPEPRNHYWVWTGPSGGLPNSVKVGGRVLRNCKGFIYDQIAHATHEKRIAKDVQILHFVNVGFLFWRDKYLLLGRFHNNYLKRFPVPFDSMLASRDIIAEAKESGQAQAGNKAIDYFEQTFICTDECREKLLANEILLTGIDIVKEKTRLEEAKRQKENTKQDL